jgi:hypothetical protein
MAGPSNVLIMALACSACLVGAGCRLCEWQGPFDGPFCGLPESCACRDCSISLHCKSQAGASEAAAAKATIITRAANRIAD